MVELNFHFATHTADSPRHILAIKKITFMFLMMVEMMEMMEMTMLLTMMVVTRLQNS